MYEELRSTTFSSHYSRRHTPEASRRLETLSLTHTMRSWWAREKSIREPYGLREGRWRRRWRVRRRKISKRSSCMLSLCCCCCVLSLCMKLIFFLINISMKWNAQVKKQKIQWNIRHFKETLRLTKAQLKADTSCWDRMRFFSLMFHLISNNQVNQHWRT